MLSNTSSRTHRAAPCEKIRRILVHVPSSDFSSSRNRPFSRLQRDWRSNFRHVERLRVAVPDQDAETALPDGPVQVESELLKAAKEIEPWTVSMYRELHRIPELLFDLPETSATIRRVLDELDIPYEYPVAKCGIVATIGSGNPVVALRADMDALPMQEPEGLDFASQNGNMHACGHDSHMAMLLGAAKLLKAREKDLNGTVRLVFQPAEEGGGGGEVMVKEGAVDGVSAMFGFHVWPTLPSGEIASRIGSITAGTNFFDVKVTGVGGHGAMPQLNVDPWPAVAEMILAYQTLVARETDPLESNVVTIGWVKGGDAHNIIPQSVEMGGTMRSLQTTGIDDLESRFVEMTEGIASAFRCKAEISFGSHYPPTVNHEDMNNFAMDVAREVLGEAFVKEHKPSMIGEDFAYFARKVPSAFLLVGTRNEETGSTALLHSPHFKMDEAVLHRGAALHTGLAMSYLQSQGNK
ncbi:hypothetical protein BSKO_03188 [Bryopsis sp. KO-2023]|nr:hypothetical protein BSKO_03188 [Bryopsis sp. KO-2023]